MSLPIATLGDVCNFENGDRGKNYPGSKTFVDSGIPFINAGHLSDDGIDMGSMNYIPRKRYDLLSSGKIKNGDILYCLRGSLGKHAMVEGLEEGAIASSLVIVRPREILDRNFLARYFGSTICANMIQKHATGAAQPNLSAKALKAFEIPLPPLAEQKRIAAILDKADAIRRKRQTAIKLADDFLRATFLHMFGDPVTNPKGWEVKPLKYSLLDARNGMSRRAKLEDGRQNIVLRLQDIRADKIILDEPNRISLSAAEKERYALVGGDIAFVRVNGNKKYVGRSAVFTGYTEPVYFNDHIIRLKFSDLYQPSFLSFVFNCLAGKHLLARHIKTSAGQNTISQKGIENIKLIIPPQKLQNKFTSFQCQFMAQIRKQDTSFHQTDQVFNSLTQLAFRGEL